MYLYQFRPMAISQTGGTVRLKSNTRLKLIVRRTHNKEPPEQNDFKACVGYGHTHF